MGAAVERAPAFNPFIVSTNVSKADAKTRKLIRSHVMLGKNLGKRRADKGTKPARGGAPTDTKDVSTSPPSSHEESRSVVPVKVGSEYALLRLAETIEPMLVHNYIQFMSYTNKAKLFPLLPCILFERHHQQWVEPMTYDTLFLQGTIFASQAALGLGSSTDRNGSVASRYFGKTVQSLRLRLEENDPAKVTADTTLMTMMILAMSALFLGQEEIVKSHLSGARRIFELRGGFASFDSSVKLLIDVLRCDIGLALSTGQPPTFFHRPIAGPFTEETPSKGTPTNGSGMAGLLPLVHQSVARMWGSLRDFSKTVNRAKETGRRLSEKTILDNMASNIYPLLACRFAMGTVSEACRLALLAFCSNAFLQWQSMNLNYRSLPSLYRQSLLGLAKSEHKAPAQAMLWLLMMGGIALFTGVEDHLWLLPWLREVIEERGLCDWDETRAVLRSFLWIDFLHDGPGWMLYEAANGQDVP